MITGEQVVNAIRSANTAGTKAAATKLKLKYLQQQKESGKDPKWVEAGIKSLITRRNNGN